MTQPLGPNQERWIAALESGEFKQGKGQLCRFKRHCCLAVACELFATEPKRNRGSAGVYWGGECMVATHSVVEALALYSTCGLSRKGDQRLSALNDAGKTFTQIAALVRNDPSMWFREPR